MGPARHFAPVLGLALLSLAAVPLAAQTAPALRRPRLTVVVVVDQLRGDLLDRFGDLFLPAGRSASEAGGFKYLSERGANFTAARYRHFPLFTGPGHAVVLTGGYPYKTGILGNDWFNKSTGKPVYCVEDPSTSVVGGGADSKAKPMSPANLRSTTVGDELKLATGGASKVVSLALKDRAAILLGGRMTDATAWFDDTSGNWVSSAYYCKSGRLPVWLDSVNGRKIPDSHFARKWNPLVSPAALARCWSPNLAGPLTIPAKLGSAFPHQFDGGAAAPGTAYYKAFVMAPWANDYVLETARQAVLGEKMGQDAIPDLLAINLSTNDYVGHAFGPYSPEVLDITVRTDRQLAEFFRFLNGAVPGGLANVTIALTADHGVAPVPEIMKAAGFPAGRLLDADLEAAAELALRKKFGAEKWIARYVEPYLYLNDQTVTAAGADPEAVQRVAARAVADVKGIYAAYSRAQIEDGRLPHTDVGSRIYLGFHPKLAGDVLVITEQLWFTEEQPQRHNTTHGSPWAYDTQVPLLITGPGVRPGTYRERVCPGDLAPSLCQLLGIGLPSSCDGVPLARALQ